MPEWPLIYYEKVSIPMTLHLSPFSMYKFAFFWVFNPKELTIYSFTPGFFFFSFFCHLLQCHTHQYCVLLSCGVSCPLGASQFAPVCSVVFLSKHTCICVLLCISSSCFKVHTCVWNLSWLRCYLFMFNVSSWYIIIVYFVGYSVMFQDVHIV